MNWFERKLKKFKNDPEFIREHKKIGDGEDLDLKELARKVDEALKKETKESMIDFLNNH